MWKIGVVGAGFISEMHLQAWSKQENAEVVALCDLDKEKLDDCALRFGFTDDQLYTSIDEMIQDTDVDVVDILTKPESHLNLVKKVSQYKKHILCQKPLAPDMQQAREIVKIAKDSGIRLMVTENWRWQLPIQNVKNIMDSGALKGKINFVKYTNTQYATPSFSLDKKIPQPYFRTMPKLMVYEMGTHWFDVWRFLFGEPYNMSAQLQSISPYVVGEDSGTVLLRHEDFIGLMEMSWASRRTLSKLKQELFFIETDLAALLVFDDGTAYIIDEEGERLLNGPIEDEYVASFERLQNHFLTCLDSGEAFQTSGEDNVKTLQLVFSCYVSSEQQKVVWT